MLPASSPCPTLAPFAGEWLRYVRGSLSDSSHRAVTYLVTGLLIPTLGDRPLADITGREVRAFAAELAERGLAAGTIRQALGALKRIYDVAVEDGLAARNPALGASRPFARLVRRGSPFPADRFHDLEVEVRRRHPHIADVLILLERTGLRVGESLGLQWREVHLDQARAWICRGWDYRERSTTKSGKGRWIALDQDVVALLARRHEDAFADAVWVFPSSARYGQPWSRSHVEDVMRAAVTALGLEGRPGRTPHALRHASATVLTEAGVDLRWLSQQLGHSSITVTHGLYARTAVMAPPSDLAAIFRAAHRKPPLPSVPPTPADRRRGGTG